MMRRPLLIVLAAGLLLASCSSGDDTARPTPSTTQGDVDPAATGTTPPTALGETVDDDTVSVTTRPTPPTTRGVETTGPQPEPGPPLPGLLDTSDDPIPNDDAVRTGELSNGVRYYIRENHSPGLRAELRLAVDAGSVDEFEPPTGVAHFVEHMLFNGTDEYPENELIRFLRGLGATFGPDINAYTAYDETVYQLTVPNDDETVQQALDVLSQWLSAATIAPDQVVAERGVVLDEWRVRTQTPSGRLFDIAADMYLAGNPYEGRQPIGTSASIDEMDADTLRSFYDAWYRPDNVAVIVVGDIDVDEIEDQIERLFAEATARSDELRADPDTTVDLMDDPDFRLHADPDQDTVDVEVTLPLPSFESDGAASDRAGLIDQMIFDILVRRLQADALSGDAPFDEMHHGSNSFVHALDAPALYAITDAERVRDTLGAVLEEYERADRFGFTERELDTARETLTSIFQTRYDGRDDTRDPVFANAYVENFLRGTPYPSIADEYELATGILDGVTTEALHLRFAARWANSAPHVIISAPESAVGEMPDRAEVLDIIDESAERDVQPRADGRELPDELMARPDPVEVVEVDALDYDFADAVKVQFANGVRVRLAETGIIAGQLYVEGASPGGTSLVADDDVIDALYADGIVNASGVADFNRVELAELLAGADASVSADLGTYREALVGGSSTNDVETLFQLIHLYMTQPRFDQVALDQLVATESPVIADPAIDPGAAGSDALYDTRYDDEPRYTVLPTPEQFDTLDLAGVERVWNDRYGDASDWVFAFSGDFDTETMIDLAASYLGSLPGSRGVETPVDVSAPAPSSVERVAVTAGTGDTATLRMLFTTPLAQNSALVEAQAAVATSLIRGRLTDVIREALGESYSPSASTSVDVDPELEITTSISVSGAPDRIGQIADLVAAELDDLATNGPTTAEFAAALGEVAPEYDWNSNPGVAADLIGDALEPDFPLAIVNENQFAIQQVSASNLQEFIATHIPADAYVAVTVEPR